VIAAAPLRRFEPCPFMGLIQCFSRGEQAMPRAGDALEIPSTYQAIDASPVPLR
jgi:hypothetical protein